MNFIKKCFFLFLLLSTNIFIHGESIITNVPLFMANGMIQIGDALSIYSMAKIFARKFNIRFCYSHFEYHDLFKFSDSEESDLTVPFWSSNRPWVQVFSEQDIINHQGQDVIFFVGLRALINYIDPIWIEELKKDISFKSEPKVTLLPTKGITVGLHIRRGNGGGKLYDGELYSQQQFDFDRSKIVYKYDFDCFVLEWQNYQRKDGYFVKDYGFRTDLIDEGDYKFKGHPALDTAEFIAVKFPPLQFYIDSLLKLSNDLGNKALSVQLFTDDKDPEGLLKILEKAVNQPNITFYYVNQRHLSFREQIASDMYTMSLFDVLIRPQSYFSRVSELMGNHKLVIHPLGYQWEEKKLLMTPVVIKGSIKSLIRD